MDSKAFAKKIETWANTMGIVGFSITPEECARYSESQMNVWNHIMTHIRPIKEISCIKKNILLHQLRSAPKSELNATGPLVGVKSCEDLKQLQLLNDLKGQIETKKNIAHSLEESVKQNSKMVIGLDKYNYSLTQELKAMNAKRLLMEMKMKTIDKVITKCKEDVGFVKDIKNFISDRKAGRIKDESTIPFQDEITNMLVEIETLYHSDDLSNGEADLSLEHSALWDKVRNCMFIKPSLLQSSLTEHLVNNNLEMDKFLKTNNRSGLQLGSIMDDIRGMNIKLYLEIHSSDKRIKSLINEVDAAKNDLFLELQKGKDWRKDKIEEQLLNQINLRCDVLMKTQKLEFLKTKLEELKAINGGNCYEFHESVLNQQTEKLHNLNKSIQEKAKITSKYTSSILSNLNLRNDDFRKKFITETVEKYTSVSSIVRRNVVGCGDGSNEHINALIEKMDGIVRNEIELYHKIPPECMFPQEITPCILNSSYKNNFLRMFHVLVKNICAKKVANSLRGQNLSLSIVKDTINAEEVLMMKQQQDKNRKCFNDAEQNIVCTVKSAKDIYKNAMVHSLLLAESVSMEIKKILDTDCSTEKLVEMLNNWL